MNLEMSAVDDVDELIEQYHLAIDEFLKGNPEPVGKLHSRRDDVTLANPCGPPVRGLDEVLRAEEHAASGRRPQTAQPAESVIQE
jgi:hypothetical protein